MQSVKDVLDSHRIVYRYVKPKAEESTDLSAILKEQLKKSDEKLDRIKEAYRNGVDTLAEYKASKLIIAAEIEQIKKQLEEVEKTIDVPSNDDSIMLDRVRNVYEIISSDVINNTTKNEILKSVIEKIVYDRDSDELKVYYYYTPEPL